MACQINKISNPAIYAYGIKLLCFDLDGTLINSSGVMSEATIKAINRVREKYALKVVLASGRPLFAADKYVDLIGATGASMFFSGALVVDVATRIAALEDHLLQERVKEIITFCRENSLTVEIYTGEEFFVDKVSSLTRVHIDDYLHVEPQVMDLLHLAQREKFLKVVIMTEQGTPGDELTKDFCLDLDDVTVSSAHGAKHPEIVFYNITSAYASRAQALDTLADQHRVHPKAMMSFGDAPADETFLKLCGVGVAMGNAAQSVQAAANLLTSSVEEDGVAEALNLIFP